MGIIFLYLQAALNLSSHCIAFFFKHTKMYVQLAPLSVNSKYDLFSNPFDSNMQIIHTSLKYKKLEKKKNKLSSR